MTADRLSAHGAIRAQAEKLQLVVQILKSCGSSDLLFQFMHGTRGLDGFDAATAGADQIVIVPARHQQGEVGRTFVQPQSAHNPMPGKPLQQSKHRRLVTLLGQSPRSCQFAQGHRPCGFQKGRDQFLQGLCPPQAMLATTLDRLMDYGVQHVLSARYPDSCCLQTWNLQARHKKKRRAPE